MRVAGRSPAAGAAWLATWLACAARLPAQTDSSALHATISAWSETTWMLFLDRGGAAGGRLNARSLLLRFHPDIDGEYLIDFVSSRPGMLEQYRWSQAENGARYWAGSINHLRLVEGADVKATVPLGGRWRARAAYTLEDNITIDRSVVRIGFERSWNGPYLFFGGTLFALKPEMDITAGVGWRSGANSAHVSVTALDLFNDAIFGGLGVFEGYADTAVDFEAQPYGLRAGADWSLGRRVRVNLEAGGLVPNTWRAYRQVAPDSGYRQHEYGFLAGGLIEYTASAKLRFGAIGTLVQAVSDRTPLPLGEAADDYRLVERTVQLGGFILAHPLSRLRSEAWVLREFRPENRDFRTGPEPDVDYEDRSWIGAAVLEYRARSGFRAHGAVEWDLRKAIRGTMPAVDPIGVHNTRLRFDLGWEFGGRFLVLGGYRVDLDKDRHINGRPRFDGAHGRFAMYW